MNKWLHLIIEYMDFAAFAIPEAPANPSARSAFQILFQC